MTSRQMRLDYEADLTCELIDAEQEQSLMESHRDKEDPESNGWWIYNDIIRGLSHRIRLLKSELDNLDIN